MFTKNFYVALSTAMICQNLSRTDLKSVTGKSLSPAYGNSDSVMMLGSTTTNYTEYPTMHNLQQSYTTNGGVILGTGTAQPTINDYCLSGELITGFTYSKSVSCDEDELGKSITGLYTITNTSGADFTIGEVGIICTPSANSSYEEYKVLIERTVLDTPVTIPAGGIGQVTYTIRMNYPTA